MEILAYLFHRSHVPWQKMGNYKTGLKTLGQNKTRKARARNKHRARSNRKWLEPKWLRMNPEDQVVCVEDPKKIVEKQLSDLIEPPPLSWTTKSTRGTTVKSSSSISNKAWAKNQSNDTTRKNLPNHCREVDAPLQCVGVEIDSLKSKWRWSRGFQWPAAERAQAWCQRCGTNRCGKLFGLIWTSGIVCVYAQLPHIGMFLRSMGGMARDGYSSAKCGKPIRWSMSLSWCIVFCPPFKWKEKKPESLKELCEEPDRMFSKKCFVWTSTWA